MAETRRLILEGAAEAYAELGVRATSMQEVARRADVSPATVLNHFPEAEALTAAVVDHLVEGLAVPDPSILDDVEDLSDRLRVLIGAVYDFYGRSEPLVDMFFRERDQVPAFQAGERLVQGLIGDLTMAALRDAARDEELVAMVQAALHPGFRNACMDVTKSAEEAKRQAGRLMSAWVASHAVPGTAGRAGRDPVSPERSGPR